MNRIWLILIFVQFLFRPEFAQNSQNQQRPSTSDADAPVDPVFTSDEPNRPDPNAPSGTSSLVFVFDVTGSMYDDLVQVREGAKSIFETVLEQRNQLIYNYVLVPFHDPGKERKNIFMYIYNYVLIPFHGP